MDGAKAEEVEQERAVDYDSTPRGTPYKKGGAAATARFFEQFSDMVEA